MHVKIAQLGSKRPDSITIAVLANVEIMCTDSVIFIKLRAFSVEKVEVKSIQVTLT